MNQVQINYAKIKDREEYIYAKDLHDNPKKREEYECLDCKSELIGKKGTVLEPHFAHKSVIKCRLIGKDRDTMTHLMAIKKMKHIVEQNRVEINQCCHKCKKTLEVHCLEKVKLEEEYSFKNERYDLALVENGEVKLVIEIYNKHKQYERLFPWVELNAKEILGGNLDILKFKCCRNIECRECKKKKTIPWIIDYYNKKEKKDTFGEIIKCESCEEDIVSGWPCDYCSHDKCYKCKRWIDGINCNCEDKVESIIKDKPKIQKAKLTFVKYHRCHSCCHGLTSVMKGPNYEMVYHSLKECEENKSKINENCRKEYCSYCKKDVYLADDLPLSIK